LVLLPRPKAFVLVQPQIWVFIFIFIIPPIPRRRRIAAPQVWVVKVVQVGVMSMPRTILCAEREEHGVRTREGFNRWLRLPAEILGGILGERRRHRTVEVVAVVVVGNEPVSFEGDSESALLQLHKRL
jgi:hypothetical protein